MGDLLRNRRKHGVLEPLRLASSWRQLRSDEKLESCAWIQEEKHFTAGGWREGWPLAARRCSGIQGFHGHQKAVQASVSTKSGFKSRRFLLPRSSFWSVCIWLQVTVYLTGDGLNNIHIFFNKIFLDKYLSLFRWTVVFRSTCFLLRVSGLFPISCFYKRLPTCTPHSCTYRTHKWNWYISEVAE